MFFLGAVPWSLGMLITTFAASPSIGIVLTRLQGAKLYLIFCVFMTLARFIAVFLSTRIKVCIAYDLLF